jgi:hypothetical protein
MIHHATGLSFAPLDQNGVFMSTTSPAVPVDATEQEEPILIETEENERAVFEKVCLNDNTRGIRFDPKHNLYVAADHKIQWNIELANKVNSTWYGWLMSIPNRKDKAKIEQLQKQVAELTHENGVLKQQLPDHQFPDTAEQSDHAKTLLRNPGKEPVIAGYGAFWQERGQDCSKLTGGHPGELSFGISYVRSIGLECQEHALIKLTDYRADMYAMRAHVAKVEGVLLDVYNQNELSLGDDQRIIAVLGLNDKTEV